MVGDAEVHPVHDAAQQLAAGPGRGRHLGQHDGAGRAFHAVGIHGDNAVLAKITAIPAVFHGEAGDRIGGDPDRATQRAHVNVVTVDVAAWMTTGEHGRLVVGLLHGDGGYRQQRVT